VRIAITVPDLGMETEEIKFGAWLIQPGAAVTAGVDLFEVEADKATVVCEAEAGGTLAETVISAPGTELKQGDLLGWLDSQ
jgi:pyruvate/2-oxoglutarate dehydrogenase complex dihydrolipoamide acyltransferase (E2) component